MELTPSDDGAESIEKKAEDVISSPSDNSIATNETETNVEEEKVEGESDGVRQTDSDSTLDPNASGSSHGEDLESKTNSTGNESISSTSSSSSAEILPQPNSELEMLTKAIWQEERYIVEYALEIGFLKLSPQTRARLNIRYTTVEKIRRIKLALGLGVRYLIGRYCTNSQVGL